MLAGPGTRLFLATPNATGLDSPRATERVILVLPNQEGRKVAGTVLWWPGGVASVRSTAPDSPHQSTARVLPLGLSTGARARENNRTLHDLLGEPAEFHGFVPRWGPLFWQLADQLAEDLLRSDDAWQEILAFLRAQGEERDSFERVFVEAIRGLEAVAWQDRVRWSDLMRAILRWALWRRPGTERQALLEAARTAQTAAERQKEITLMGQTIGETIWEEAWNKGLVKGLADGQAAAQAAAQAAELQRSRQLLCGMLEDRFGPLPEAVRQRIEVATDIERVKAATRQVLHLPALENLEL